MGGTITSRDAAARHTVFTLLCGLTVMGVCAVAMAAPAAAGAGGTPICQRDGCNCTTTANYWIRANCTFDNKQVVELEADSLPPHLLELDITCTELNLSDGAFARLHSLQRVRIRRVGRVRVRRNAFNNLASKQTLVEIVDCGSVVLETHAFRGVQGPLVALVARCGHVVVQGTAFSWLAAVTVKDVPRLELAEKAFSFEKPRSSPANNHGPATTVLLQNVMIPELPSSAFPTSAAELRVVDSEVRIVRRDAFCALQLSSVVLHNSSLHRVETGAFSERTFIESLEMTEIRVRSMAANAVQGAIQRLTIQHSRLVEVVSGAINITVATVTLSNNVFEKVRSRAFVFRSWNRLGVDRNIFQWTESDAFSVQFDHLHAPGNTFTFTRNIIADFGPGAFGFAAEALAVDAHLDVLVADNQFAQGCRCNLDEWIRDAVTAGKGSQDAVEWIFNTSFCSVDFLLAKCFNVAQGFVNMRNFSEIVCSSANVIVCEEASQGKIEISVVQDVDSRVPAGYDTAYESEMDVGNKVLVAIFLFVVSCVAAICMVTLLVWLKKNGYCVQARILYMPSTTSCVTVFHRVFASFRGGGGIVAANSISRINVREYTEIHQQRQQQRAAVIAMEGGTDLDNDYNEFVPLEDKWTQTLPEELTQELLQSLREKLDDPENYSEARDMIEHLYDLIKVEESCSNNNTPSTSDTIEVYDDDIEDNLYDVIQLPISTPAKRSKQCNGKTSKTMCHVGTRAPSPDKLLPAATYAQIKRTRKLAVITDYAQPHDHQQHLYTELPGDPPQAPVPPPKPPPVPTSPIPTRAPSRPLSFLRALGESLVTPKTALHTDKVKPTGPPLVSDYAEPTDLTLPVHEYSELPTVAKCSNKMANRPLPHKPDQASDPGEGTSLST